MGWIDGKLARMKEGRLTESRRKIIAFLESSDVRRTARLSITMFAAEAGVAEASVLRFCRALGYEGYVDFRLDLVQDRGARTVGEIGFIDDLAETYARGIEKCRRELDGEGLAGACQMLASARMVVCVTSEDAAGWTALRDGLLLLGIFAVSENDAQIRRLLLSACDRRDVVLIMGKTTRETVRTAELARSREIGLIAVACGRDTFLAEYADKTLFPGAEIRDAVVKSFLTDVILAELYRLDRPRFSSAVARGGYAVAETKL